jgi:hypothetical protein
MARYEMPDQDGSPSPEKLIQGFCLIISSLSPHAQAIWAAARERVIDLGYEMGSHEDRIQDTLSPSTLQQMAALEIGLSLTIYPRVHETISGAQ